MFDLNIMYMHLGILLYTYLSFHTIICSNCLSFYLTIAICPLYKTICRFFYRALIKYLSHDKRKYEYYSINHFRCRPIRDLRHCFITVLWIFLFGNKREIVQTD